MNATKRVIDTRVINVDELTLHHFSEGTKFECSAERVGPLIGAKQLGYSYDVVPPGKSACPFHAHYAEEEMFFVVSGHGKLRYGDESRAIRAGDFICCPTGGVETAHQIINDSADELRYISVSTKADAEICHYPDSKKIGSFAGPMDKRLRHMTMASATVDYWKDE